MSKRYQALIADDSALVREMLQATFMEKANFDVEAVNTGLEAWERLKKIKSNWPIPRASR